jgi:hypothetical protein
MKHIAAGIEMVDSAHTRAAGWTRFMSYFLDRWYGLILWGIYRDSSACTATSYGLKDQAADYLDHRARASSGAHRAAYPTGTGTSFPGGRAAVP